jgi:hypothetical protein
VPTVTGAVLLLVGVSAWAARRAMRQAPLLPDGVCPTCGFADGGDVLLRTPIAREYPCPPCLEPELAARLAGRVHPG